MEVLETVFTHYYVVSVNPVLVHESTSLIESESESPCEASSPPSSTIIQECKLKVSVCVCPRGWVSVCAYACVKYF